MGHGKCLRPITRWVGGVKKGQKHAYVIFEWSLATTLYTKISRGIIKSLLCLSSISNNMSDTRFRLVVMGDSYVGKSSIIKRFLHGTFDINYVATGTHCYFTRLNLRKMGPF